jgi:hypothetical protein
MGLKNSEEQRFPLLSGPEMTVKTARMIAGGDNNIWTTLEVIGTDDA